MNHCTTVFIGMQMTIMISQISGYNINCPASGHWKFRAIQICQDIQSYTCIYDENNQNIKETCDGPVPYGKGYKAILRGNIDRQPCSESRYQPYPYSTLWNSKCVFLRSGCSAEGQFTVINGVTFEDRICGCDYRKGYAFMNKTSSLFRCTPSKDDCSCYKKSCPVEKRFLSKDYQCTDETNVQTTILPETRLEGIEIVRKETSFKENLLGDHDTIEGRLKTSIMIFIVILLIIGFAMHSLFETPLFVNELTDVQCIEGQAVELKCRLKKKGEIPVWFINDTEIMDNTRFKLIPGDYIHTLMILKTNLEDSGQITVMVKKDESRALLRVERMFVEKLKDECCAIGQSASFTCRLKENVQVTWYHYNTKILTTGRTKLFSKNNAHTLKIIDVTLEDRGQYTIEAHTIEAHTIEAHTIECRASLVIIGNISYPKTFYFGENIVLEPTYDKQDLKWNKDKKRDQHSKAALFEDEGIYCAHFDYRIIRAHVQITDEVRITKEDANYLLIIHLIAKTALPAVRHIFDVEFHPQKLKAIIYQNKKKLNDLKEKRHINNRQWNLLTKTMREKEKTSSRMYDLRLLICLLRNIGPRLNVIDELPEPKNESVEASLSRVKYYRNEIAYNHDHGRLLDQQFSTIWNGLNKSIADLLSTTTNSKDTESRQGVLHCTSDGFAKAWMEFLRNKCIPAYDQIRMSFDEMCYLRTVHILHRVACQAVRIKFNSIFTSQKLREILTKDKGEITNIYKNKTQITPSEWSVLYPDNGLPVSENFGLKLLIFLLLRYGHKSLTIPENKAVLQLETISHKVAESSNGNFNDHDFDKILEKIFKSIITLSGKYGERFRKICCFLCPENCKKLLDLEPDDAVFTYEVQIPAEKLD